MDLSGTGRPPATSSDDNDEDELGQVMAVIVRLRELRDQGFEYEEIARRVAVDHPQTPGGGTWSGTTVEQVLRVADMSEFEHRRSVDSGAVVDRSGSERRHAPLPNRPGLPGRAMRPLSAQPAPRPSTGADIEIDGDRYPVARSRSRLGLAVGLLAVLAVAGAAYYVLSSSSDQTVTEPAGTGRSISDEERSAASQALLSAVTDGTDASDETRASSGQSVGSTTDAGRTTDPADGGTDPTNRPPVVVDIDDLPRGDRADMLTIRVEGDDGDRGDSGLSPATATIRTDGKLHVEGVFPTRAAADAFVAQATRIFGPEALVESYTVDPAALRPTVSDVALDKPVLFESGSSEIHPDYIPFLEACAGVLKANSHIVMSVSAHTDSLGDEQFNLELSRQRARAIVDFYRDLEIADAQLLGTGFGEQSPVAENTSAQGRERNRRAMLQLLNIMDEGE